MKSFVLAFAALIMTAGAFAQTTAPVKVKTAPEVIKFKETTHDFGKIQKDVPVTYEFEFTNVSDKPVVIENVSTSCGCTTPQWPQTPVAKGKTDKIKAGFNAQTVGQFTKTIYVKVAGVDRPIELRITGEVLPKQS